MINDDDVSQLGDYDAPFCEQQYTHRSCYISLLKFKSFDQLRELSLFSSRGGAGGNGEGSSKYN